MHEAEVAGAAVHHLRSTNRQTPSTTSFAACQQLHGCQLCSTSHAQQLSGDAPSQLWGFLKALATDLVLLGRHTVASCQQHMPLPTCAASCCLFTPAASQSYAASAALQSAAQACITSSTVTKLLTASKLQDR
jgi:hypothetical protein